MSTDKASLYNGGELYELEEYILANFRVTFNELDEILGLDRAAVKELVALSDKIEIYEQSVRPKRKYRKDPNMGKMMKHAMMMWDEEPLGLKRKAIEWLPKEVLFTVATEELEISNLELIRLADRYPEEFALEDRNGVLYFTRYYQKGYQAHRHVIDNERGDQSWLY